MHGWMNDDKVMIACCNDGTRPVIIKIERIDEDDRQIGIWEDRWYEIKDRKSCNVGVACHFLCVNVTYGLDKVCTLRLCSNCHYYCLWNNKYCVLALP